MKYETKPVEIEAVKYTGGNSLIVIKFTEGKAKRTMGDNLIIPTLEGDYEAKVGDYIIRGLKGEFYPCKPDIFVMTYEPKRVKFPEIESSLCCNAPVISVGDEYYEPEKVKCTICNEDCRTNSMY